MLTKHGPEVSDHVDDAKNETLERQHCQVTTFKVVGNLTTCKCSAWHGVVAEGDAVCVSEESVTLSIGVRDLYENILKILLTN